MDEEHAVSIVKLQNVEYLLGGFYMMSETPCRERYVPWPIEVKCMTDSIGHYKRSIFGFFKYKM